MDIKWKDWIGSIATKIIAVLLICIGMIGSMQLVINIVAANNYRYQEESYYETDQFESYFVRQAGLARDWIVRYADKNIFEESAISESQIKQYTQYEIEKAEGEEELLQNIEKRYGSLIANKTPEQKIRYHVIQIILKDRKDYYEEIQYSLMDNNVTFMFLAENKENGNVISNIPTYNGTNKEEIISFIKKQNYTIEGNAYKVNVLSRGMQNRNDYYDRESLLEEKGQNCRIYAYQKEIADSKVEDNFLINKRNFDKDNYIGKIVLENTKKAIPIVIIMIIVGIVGVILLTLSTGHSKKEQLQSVFWDVIPIEIQLIFLAISIFIGIIVVVNTTDISMIWYTSKDTFPTYIFKAPFGILALWMPVSIAFIVGFMGIAVYTSIVRSVKSKTLKEHLFLVKIAYIVYEGVLQERYIKLGVCLAILAYLFLNTIGILMLFMIYPIIIIPILIVFNIAVLAIIFKWIKEYQELVKSTKAIADGNLEQVIPINQTLPAFRQFASYLMDMKKGITLAAQKATKSERMKTELITNVSHDLKTPLTSIISYVELLEKEPIELETAKEYIQILKERSEKLRYLIEDLVEASKAATGNLEVHIEPIQLDKLIEQIIGEYSDQLEMKKLQLVWLQKTPLTIKADARHLYRAIDNLFSNVNKYAMPNTRVYIETTKEEETLLFTIKNISAAPIAVAEADLTERFVRGDMSRTTEGSGLGLAIAKNLIELQEGKLEVGVDGDLFKVSIQLKIYK